MGYHHTRDKLTPENLLELDPRKDQLGMGQKQILPDPKTKAWVDEQNRIKMEQTLAMHDLADMTEQRTYDSMFAAVPIYHGNDDEDFDEWADQLEALCEISQQNIHHEMMGKSSAAVKKIIRSIDPTLRWSLA